MTPEIKYSLPRYTRGPCVWTLEGMPPYAHMVALTPYMLREIEPGTLNSAVVAEADMEAAMVAVKSGGYVVVMGDEPIVHRCDFSEGMATGEIFPLVSANKAKTACVVRLGGFGDMLQTAAVLPGLKAQGFHVTVMTKPGGKAIIEHDPHVDEWYLLDTDQVPNHELPDFFGVVGKQFERFVNLCESVEGTFLAMPGRVSHTWPDKVRHKLMNRNYHEFAADLAGVVAEPCRLFYPTEEEKAKARGLANPDEFTVLWALAGSSTHKFSPWQDAVVARIMLDMPEARVIYTGDEWCKILECGWEDEPRVSCLSGEIGIRESLALAQMVDCVVGPETGVLNAVAFERDVSKVIMLSHSSEHNLTKHWVKTQTLAPKDCACFPCHRLHYGNEFCNTDEETGAAMCAKKIPATDIYDAIHKVYANWKKRR